MVGLGHDNDEVLSGGVDGDVRDPGGIAWVCRQMRDIDTSATSWARMASPNASRPTRPTIAVATPCRAHVTACYCLAPGTIVNKLPMTVSPGDAAFRCSAVRSMDRLPTTRHQTMLLHRLPVTRSGVIPGSFVHFSF